MACVIDSYDAIHFARDILGEQYRDQIMSREGTFVVRPDSGDPTSMPLDIIDVLMEKFGYTVNSKGYRVLPEQVRVIQGDGMNIDSIRQLTQNAMNRGISTSNFAMGMGGGLLQKVDRDTCKYAMKANAIEIDGEWQDVFKDPITDHGKKSKRGRQAVLRIGGDLMAHKFEDVPTNMGHGISNQLRPVYRDGELLEDVSFSDIRKRASL
jgi:nicotinamide phosphoribosyltransferase